MTKYKFRKSFFHPQTLAIIEFQINHKKKMLKKCRKVWWIKNNPYICKVNKAQNEKTKQDESNN